MRQSESAIECVTEGRSILLPAGAIEQLVEYEVLPLPLSRPHVSGMARREGQLVLSLRLDVRAPATRRRTTGALLAGKGSGNLRWAIEMTRALSLVSLKPSGLQRRTKGPAWMREVETATGRVLPLIDVDALVADSMGIAVVAAGGELPAPSGGRH